MAEYPRGFTLQAQAVGPADATAPAAQVTVPAIAGAAPVVTAIEAQLWTPRWAPQWDYVSGTPASIAMPAIAGVSHVLDAVSAKLLSTAAAAVGVVVNVNGSSVLELLANASTGGAYEIDTADRSGMAFAIAAGSALTVAFSAASASTTEELFIQGFDVTQRTPQIQWSPDGGFTWNGLGTLQTPDFSDYAYSGELAGTPGAALEVAVSCPAAPGQTQTLIVQGYYI